VVSKSSSKVEKTREISIIHVLSGFPCAPVFPRTSSSLSSSSSQPFFGFFHLHSCNRPSTNSVHRYTSHAQQRTGSAHCSRTCSTDCPDWSRGAYYPRDRYNSRKRLGLSDDAIFSVDAVYR